MDEEDILSEPVENLPQYSTSDPSGRGKDSRPPKNPSGGEALFIVSILGILPDVIDFFSIGALSFLSSALSWPMTELYFYHKNLKVPNIKKWMRWSNIGDIIPFVGVIPLKTIGLIAAIYMAWHPESKFTKGAQGLDAATGGKAATKKLPRESGGGLRERGKKFINKYIGRGEEGDVDEGFGLAYDKKGERDVYEIASEGGGKIQGPEEEAQDTSFGETISTPPQEEETRVAHPAPPRQKQTTEEITPSAATQGKKTEEDESAKIGGVYEENKAVMKTMTSTGEIEDILKEKPFPINPPPSSQEVQSSDDGREVNLKHLKDNNRQDGPTPREGSSDSLKKAA